MQNKTQASFYKSVFCEISTVLLHALESLDKQYGEATRRAQKLADGW